MRRPDAPVWPDAFVVVRGGIDFVTLRGHGRAGVELRLGHELTTARCHLSAAEAERLIAALRWVLDEVSE